MPLDEEIIEKLFGTDIKSTTTEQFDVCQTHIRNDTKKMLYWAQHHKIPTILLDYYQPDLFSIFYNLSINRCLSFCIFIQTYNN